MSGAGANSQAGGGGGGGVPASHRYEELVQTGTISSQATLDLTGLTEDLYLLVLKDLSYGDNFSTDRQLRFRTSSDGGANWDETANDYFWSKTGRNSSGGTQTGSSVTGTNIETGSSSALTTTTPERRTYGEIYISNIGNIARTTTINGTLNGSDGDLSDFAGIRSTAQVDDGVRLYASAGTLVAGSYYLYKVVEGTL